MPTTLGPYEVEGNPQGFRLSASLSYVWDVATLDWIEMTQPGGVGGDGDGAIVDGASATIKATVRDYTGANPLTVEIVDTNGDPVSVGGGTQYAEDTATAAGEIVTMAGVVRNDTRGSLVGADGDRTELQVNGSGDLRVDGSAVTQPISAASLPLPAGAATAALQTQPGVDIGDVTVNNGAGAASVNIQDGGNVITVDGSVTANAGTNLNTSLLALEAGGNLATTVARLTSILAQLDVALSTRLAEATFTARINTQGQKAMAASTPVVLASDQTSIPVTGPLTDTELRAAPVEVTGSFSASTAADVMLADDNAGYTDGDLSKNLTQTPDGRLRTLAGGLVSDVPNSYLDGETRALSLTNEGRLRVSTIRPENEFFVVDEEVMWSSRDSSYWGGFDPEYVQDHAHPYGEW